SRRAHCLSSGLPERDRVPQEVRLLRRPGLFDPGHRAMPGPYLRRGRRAQRLRHAVAADGNLRLRRHAVVGRPDQAYQGRHPDAALTGQVAPCDGVRGGAYLPSRIPVAVWSIRRGNKMPVYDYLCKECGPFTEMRPMAECDEPQDCPQCAGVSPRAILTAPNFFCMPSDRRKAHATNERSANAPKTLGEYKASHRPG